MSVAELRDLLGAAEHAVVNEWIASSGDSVAGSEIELAGAPHTALDRITQIGAALLDDSQTVLFADVIETFVHLFRAATDDPTLGTTDAGYRLRPDRWRDIAVRVYTLGALAVVRSHFAAIPGLVIQSSNSRRSGDYWLRETVTALARAGKFEPTSLLPVVADYVSDRDVFHQRFHRNKDRVINALCQFDFLQCVISTAETDNIHACYPNFGAFFKERTEPIVESLVSGGPAKAAVPGLSDVRLATIIMQLDALANSEFFRYAAWHAGNWESETVRSFLREHAPV